MKKKIVGILVVMLLLSSTVLSVAGNMNGNINDVGSKTTNWLEQEKLVASDGAVGNWFGYSVCVSGDYVIVGAVNADSFAGSAYIFKNTGAGWTEEAKLTASDSAVSDLFGISVSINGDYAIVGAHGNDDNGANSGSAYIFINTGAGWIEEDKITASDGADNDEFGWSVSINGDYAVVAAPEDDSGKGSAYMFKNTGKGWTEDVKLTASDGESNDRFGYSVFINGDYVIVGAQGDDSITGSAYIFKNTGTDWIEEAKLTASDGEPYDWFGRFVTIDNDYAIITAPADDSRTGATYIFKNTGMDWTEEVKLTASDGANGDWFGRSVSLNGDYITIGAVYDDSNTGSAYIFKNTGAGWTEEAKLTASDGEPDDHFGTVSISGDYVAVGAPGDDSFTGSVYVFKRFAPDLDCIGTIGWTDVETGSTVTDDFNISNIGNTGTELNWEIESYPDWGIWTFNPSSGVGLTPEDGQITVDVSVVAPEEKNLEFTGEIKVVNKDDSNDYSIISVSLSTSKTKLMYTLFLNFLENHPNLFPLIRQILGL
jgi:hypothetical protein